MDPLQFIRSQKLMALASRDDKDIWIANVYMSIGDDSTIYFISSVHTRHSNMIVKNPDVAFSIAWHDASNHKNRKAIQGLGTCHIATNPIEIATGIKLLYENFPDLRDILSVQWIIENAQETKVWVLKPSYMKFWNDELYGEDGSKEFSDFIIVTSVFRRLHIQKAGSMTNRTIDARLES